MLKFWGARRVSALCTADVAHLQICHWWTGFLMQQGTSWERCVGMEHVGECLEKPATLLSLRPGSAMPSCGRAGWPHLYPSLCPTGFCLLNKQGTLTMCLPVGGSPSRLSPVSKADACDLVTTQFYSPFLDSGSYPPTCTCGLLTACQSLGVFPPNPDNPSVLSDTTCTSGNWDCSVM